MIAAGKLRVAAMAVIASIASLALVALPSTVATAATPEILVSDNGVDFAPELTAGLFDDLGLLVPEESVTASLWVRNTAATDASMRLSANDLISSSPIFTQYLSLSAVAGSQTWTWTFAELTACETVIPAMLIPAGETVRIDMVVTMGDAQGQQAQDESVQLGFTVDARDAVNPFPPEACADPGDGEPGEGEGDPDESLSNTGANVFRLTLLSVGLFVIGLIVVLSRRRRDEQENV